SVRAVGQVKSVWLPVMGERAWPPELTEFCVLTNQRNVALGSRAIASRARFVNRISALQHYSRYGLHLLAQAWQNWSFWQTVFDGPQAHGAGDGCSALQDIAGALALGAARPFASAKPTDMTIARKATAEVFSIISSSLGLGGSNNTPQRKCPSEIVIDGRQKHGFASFALG